MVGFIYLLHLRTGIMRFKLRQILKIFLIAFSCAFLLSPANARDSEILTGIRGDLPKILERHTLRILVSYDNVGFYMEKGRQDGLYVAMMKKFEQYLRQKYVSAERLKLYFIPVREDEMMKLIADGYGDLALGITPTNEFKRYVDFSIPEKLWLKEIAVTKIGTKEIKSLQDFAGRTVWARRSSSYYVSLNLLNDYLKASGLMPVNIVGADEFLTDADLVDMVGRGEIPATIVNDSKLVIWRRYFGNVVFNMEAPIKVNSTLNWAIRHNSPLLYKEINLFLRSYRDGTAQGTKVYDQYMRTHPTYRARVERQDSERLGINVENFKKFSNIFQKYGKHYGIDWILLMAQSYQESTLNPNARSNRGAVGIMQVLPSTAQEWYIGVDGVNDLDNNVHAGTKYMRYMLDSYFNEPELSEYERMLLALAAYNCGPNRITKYREEARTSGLNPNVWFGNVEAIAASHGATETVNYVQNISELYVSYQESYKINTERQKTKMSSSKSQS